MHARAGRAPARLVLFLALGLLFPRDAMAQKTDVVVFRNGDRLTCEIRTLERGLLQVKTDSLSTVNIEWADVVSITSSTLFEVEMTDGLFHYGTLSTSTPGELTITGADGPTVVDMANVFRAARLELGFWRRLEGNLDFGGSYTQSSGIGQTTIGSAVGARRPGFQWRVTYDTTVTVQEDDGGVTSRQSMQATYAKLLPNRWMIPGFAFVDRNQELGFDVRSTIGGGVGRTFIQSGRTIFGGGGGFAYNEELPVEGESTSNFEALLFLSYEVFTYNFPKLEVRTSVTAFPGLSDAGRIRLSSKAQFKREFFSSDFYTSFTIYDDYDNRPPGGAAKSNDFGVTFSLGVKF